MTQEGYRKWRVPLAFLWILVLLIGGLPLSLAWFVDTLDTQLEVVGEGVGDVELWAEGSGRDSPVLLVQAEGTPTGEPLAVLRPGEAGVEAGLTVKNVSTRMPAKYRLSFGVLEEDGNFAGEGAAGVPAVVAGYTVRPDTGVLPSGRGLLQRVSLGSFNGEKLLPPGESIQYGLEFRYSPQEIAALGIRAGTLAVYVRVERYPVEAGTHFVADGGEFRALLEGETLENGDTVALLNDIVLDGDIRTEKLFNLALNGYLLDLNRNTLAIDAGEAFGTMDFSAAPQARCAFGRKGAVSGTLSISAPNTALRIPEDSLGAVFSELDVRLFNGEPLPPEGAARLAFTLPEGRSYPEIPMAQGFSGDGTRGNPYRIASIADYRKLERDVNTLSAPDGYAGIYFRLIADLDFTGLGEVPPIGGNPSGAERPPVFRGNFDGAGHRLIGLQIRVENGSAGIFGAVEEGSVQNLEKSGGYVFSAGEQVGGIAGTLSNGAVIRGCCQTGVVAGSKEAASVGGLVGICSKGARLLSCVNVGEVNPGETSEGPQENSGGIVGTAGDAYIQDCYSLDSACADAIGSGDGGAYLRSRETLNSAETVDSLNRAAPFAYRIGDGGYPALCRGRGAVQGGGGAAPEENPGFGGEDGGVYSTADDTSPEVIIPRVGSATSPP